MQTKNCTAYQSTKNYDVITKESLPNAAKWQELMPSCDIEHIMPEDNTHWQVDDDIHEAYLRRLGNLALLSGPKNISISNKIFDIKKATHATSKIEPNKELANSASWTSNEIDARQNLFANYALKFGKNKCLSA